MSRDPRYDILFEPVRIGPLTARNRSFPLCPNALAASRLCPIGQLAARLWACAGRWSIAP